ncbi:MAG TPA: hypothetical protein VF510_09440 [Ktedonobacterales bacterium]
MPKLVISVLSAIGFGLNLVGVVLGKDAFLLQGLGFLIGLLAWIGAMQNAWWCKAYGWLVVVFFTFWLGAFAYGHSVQVD